MKVNDKLVFDFEAENPSSSSDVIRINPSIPYEMERGYGFAVTAQPSKNEDLRDSWPGDYFIPAVQTFLVDLPYGIYTIAVTLGSANVASCTTVKAGPGRLMLHEVETATGQLVRETFAVQVDDGRLKLAFSGPAPGVRLIEIERTPHVPTLFFAGDSTVNDQPSNGYPYASWGQMISLFLTSNVAVSNHARSGRSSKSFINEGRLNKIWKQLRRSDYLLVQFAHNDEKNNDGGTQPYSTYQQYLKQYIDGARQRGAYPVLVAPMHRRFFDDEGLIRNTHGEYIEAMRQLADRENVPFLDLAVKSKQFFDQLGEERTKSIFMWAEPGQYPSMPDGAKDNTHFSEKGGIEMARLVVECIRETGIKPLQCYLR